MEAQLKEAFGKVIKELRTQAGISQQELADYAELDRTYLSDLERGLYNPTLFVFYKLCDILKVKPSKAIDKIDKLMGK